MVFMEECMTEFKVGDRVRSRCFPDWGDMTVVSVDMDDLFRDMEISADADDGRRGAFAFSDVYLVSAAETDAEAAERIGEQDIDPVDIAAEAIAWARANPR